MSTRQWFVAPIVAMTVLAASPAVAGEKQGKITSVHMAQTHINKVFVKIEGSHTQPEPACSAGFSGWDFVLDISQSTGKAIFSQLAVAQYTQIPVQIVGTNECALHGGYETLSYIVIEH